MPLNTLHRIMSSIEKQWNILESFLSSPTKLPEFDSYLNHYRGLPNSQTNFSFKRNELAESSSLGVCNFFINIFSLEGLAELENKDIETVLSEVEKNVNLALYYWFGLNDRNYQFRTWIHFFALDGISSVFLTKEKQDYSVTLSENGIYFGNSVESRLPQILPISKVLVSTHNMDGDYEKKIFARIRIVQREVCLLVDEWEYQNSILAVEYGQSLQILQNNKNSVREESHKLLLKKMDIKRNFLARFCLESFCDFQEWVNGIHKQNSNSDITAEIDALCALTLASLQKLFLPASISRLVYGNDVILLVQRFLKARLDYCPEDFSARLVMQATESAQGSDFNTNLFRMVDLKPFEWKLCFDPSPGLKAFSWAYSKQHHIFLCVFLGICYFKKSFSNHLDEHLLSDLASSFQAQEVFLSYLMRESLHENPCSVQESDIKQLFDLFSVYLDADNKHSKDQDSMVGIIKNYLS